MHLLTLWKQNISLTIVLCNTLNENVSIHNLQKGWTTPLLFSLYHGVAFPLRLITHAMRTGIEVTSFSTVSGGIFPHSSLRTDRNCSTVLGRRWRTFLLRILHKFSIGFKSGLEAGQGSTWRRFVLSHSVVFRAVWGRALSCWNIIGRRGWVFRRLFVRFLSSMSIYTHPHLLSRCKSEDPPPPSCPCSPKP